MSGRGNVSCGDYHGPSLEQLLPSPVEGHDSGDQGRGSGVSAQTFVTYASLGFGSTLILIILVVGVCWLVRRKRVAGPAATGGSGAGSELDQRLEPLKKAPQPFLVVHPAGDAVVAFKDLERGASGEEDGQGGDSGGSDSIKAACGRSCPFCSSCCLVAHRLGGEWGVPGMQQEPLPHHGGLTAAARPNQVDPVAGAAGEVSPVALLRPPSAGAGRAEAALGPLCRRCSEHAAAG